MSNNEKQDLINAAEAAHELIMIVRTFRILSTDGVNATIPVRVLETVESALQEVEDLMEFSSRLR